MSVRNILKPYQVDSEMPVDLSAFAQDSFIDEFPLATRLSRTPIGSNKFDIITHSPRPRDLALGADIVAAGDGTITLDNVSSLMQGDVLEVGAERVEVHGAITITNDTTGAGTVEVRRAVEGTTATDATASPTTHTVGDSVYLVGNSRDGGEVDQEAYRVQRTLTEQFIQTFQFPIQVGGRTAALSDMVLPPGSGNSRTPNGGPVLTREEEDKLRDMMKDIESTSLYGLGQAALAANGRWKQKGLRLFSSIGGNLVDDPVNKAAYKPSDFSRDITQNVADKGGKVDIIVCATNWGQAWATWGHAHMAIPAGETRFGTPISVFETSLFPGIAIWYSRAMRPGHCAALDSSRVRMRYIRPESYKPRGSRGDAFEGDWISDMGIEIEDPEQAVAWVEGVTQFSPASGFA